MNKNKEYKFATEIGVSMFLDKYQILQQVDLDMFAKSQTVFDYYSPCHIYFILKRPRVIIDPNYLSFDKKN